MGSDISNSRRHQQMQYSHSFLHRWGLFFNCSVLVICCYHRFPHQQHTSGAQKHNAHTCLQVKGWIGTEPLLPPCAPLPIPNPSDYWAALLIGRFREVGPGRGVGGGVGGGGGVTRWKGRPVRDENEHLEKTKSQRGAIEFIYVWSQPKRGWHVFGELQK